MFSLSRFLIQLNSFVFLQNLVASDAGAYKCTLSNELGTAVAIISMKVAGSYCHSIVFVFIQKVFFFFCFVEIAEKASLDQVDRIAPAFEKPKITQDAKQKSIKIECRCKGKPEPKFTWKKGKTELKDTPNKYKITKTKEANDTYVFVLEILVSDYRIFFSLANEQINFMFRMLLQLTLVFIKSQLKTMVVILKHQLI